MISHTILEEPPLVTRSTEERQDLGGSKAEILGPSRTPCFHESDTLERVAMEIVHGKSGTLSSFIELLRPVMIASDFIAVQARIRMRLRQQHSAILRSTEDKNWKPSRVLNTKADMLSLAEQIAKVVVQERESHEMESMNSAQL